MNLPAPEISIRILNDDHVDALCDLLNQTLAVLPYSAPLNSEMTRTHLLDQEPPTAYPVRWQHNRVLGAWRAGQLIGFVNIGVGLDADSLHLPDYEPIGLLRFLALPTRDDLIEETARKLLAAADDAWRRAGVGFIKAFHISTGYPSFQAGAGLLPSEMADQFRILTANGYRLVDRYYALRRKLGELMEEEVPMADLSLVHRGDADERRYEVYHRRAERIAHACMVRVTLAQTETPLRVAYVTDIKVDSPWRNRNIARWLLRRMVNDATLEGYEEMLAHLRLNQHIAMSLFTQQGFDELDYRGYTLDKTFGA